MVSGSPSLIQVTVVAGEPVEVQVRVEDEDPLENTKSLVPMVGVTVGKIWRMEIFMYIVMDVVGGTRTDCRSLHYIKLIVICCM